MEKPDGRDGQSSPSRQRSKATEQACTTYKTVGQGCSEAEGTTNHRGRGARGNGQWPQRTSQLKSEKTLVHKASLSCPTTAGPGPVLSHATEHIVLGLVFRLVTIILSSLQLRHMLNIIQYRQTNSNHIISDLGPKRNRWRNHGSGP